MWALNKRLSLNARKSDFSSTIDMVGAHGPRTQGGVSMSCDYVPGLCEAAGGLGLRNRSSDYQGEKAPTQTQRPGSAV